MTDVRLGMVVTIGQWQLVVSGNRVSVAEALKLSPDILRVLQEGPVRGLELMLAGRLVLHASSVAVGERAVAILGSAGAGKSSLSTMLTRSAGWLVSDGMTSIDLDERAVDTGLSRFKLSDEALRNLGEDPEQFERVSSMDPKRYYPFLSEQPAQSSRLAAIFHLVEGTELSLRRLEPSEQLVFLTAHGYLSNFLPASYRPVIWERTQRLMQAVPDIFELRRPRGWEHMPSVVRCVLDQVSQLQTSPP